MLKQYDQNRDFRANSNIAYIDLFKTHESLHTKLTCAFGEPSLFRMNPNYDSVISVIEDAREGVKEGMVKQYVG